VCAIVRMMKCITISLIYGLLGVAAASAEDGKVPTAEETVTKLYADHLANKGMLVEEDKRQVWTFAFGEELVKVLKSDDRGFDPLFFAQDAEIKDLKVKEIDRDEKANTLVLVTFKNFGKRTALVVSCMLTDHGFQIQNITEPATGVDLLNDLAGDS
jgi:hypothetical protein